MNIEQDRFTRILERCIGLMIRGKSFKVNDLVARDRVLNPRRQPFQFSRPKPFFNQQLNLSKWPQFCDHSVTSANVRLNVGLELFILQERPTAGKTALSFILLCFARDCCCLHFRGVVLYSTKSRPTAEGLRNGGLSGESAVVSNRIPHAQYRVCTRVAS
jgi:hypothetical protein